MSYSVLDVLWFRIKLQNTLEFPSYAGKITLAGHPHVKLFREKKLLSNIYVFKELNCLTVRVYSNINKGAEANAFTVL